jgi:hypothetical protein
MDGASFKERGEGRSERPILLRGNFEAAFDALYRERPHFTPIRRTRWAGSHDWMSGRREHSESWSFT